MNAKTLPLILAIASLITTGAFAETAASSAAAPAAAAAEPTPVAPTGELYLQTSPSDSLKWSLSFPIWIPGIGGDVSIKGNDFEPDQDTGDVIDILETHLNIGAVVHVEAEKNRCGFIVDAMYVDLRSTGTGGLTDAELVFKGFIGEVAGFYTIIAPEADKKGWGAFRLDALAGLRVNVVEIGIDSDLVDAHTNNTLFDPIVGARLELGLTNWMSFKLRGDVGGFGIEAWEASHLALNLETGLELHLATWFDLGLGYRWLKYDIVSESGNSSFDATLSGPVITLVFNF